MAGNQLDIVINAIDQASGTLNKIGIELGKQQEAVKGLEEVSSRQTETGAKQAATAGGIAAALAGATAKAAEYGQGMANVNSITKVSGPDLRRMGDAVLDIARDPMVLDMPATLAEGLYDINSSGLAGAAAMDTLAIASKGASAGQSDTATAAAVLVATMNAYNRKTGPDAANIMDTLFKTVDRGKINFDQLAASLGNVTATAATVGVPIEEIGAAISTMTKRGVQAPEAITNLRALLMQFLAPGTEFKKLIASSGYETGLQIIKTRGLSGAMEWLTQVTGGSADKLAQALGSVEAINGAMTLGGEGAGMFADDLDALRNSSGAMEAALAQQAEGPMFKWRRGMKDMQIAVITFGSALLPVMNLVSGAISRTAQWFDRLSPSTKTAVAYAAVGAVVVLGLAAAYNLTAGSIVSAIASMRVAQATQAVLATQTGATTTALGLTSGATSALGTAWTAMAARGVLAWGAVTTAATTGARAQWAAQWAATGKLPMLGAMWTGFAARVAASGGIWPMIKIGATGAGTALKGLIPAIKGIGKSIGTFLLSPLGVVIIMSGIAIALVYRAWKMYKEMRQAQEEAKKNEAQAKAADEAAGVQRDASGAIVNRGRLKTPGRGAAGTPAAATPAASPATTAEDSGVPDFNALLKQARESAAAEANKGEGVAGAQQYLDFIKQQQGGELSKLQEQAKSGDADAAKKLVKAQEDAAAAIADAEVNVSQETRDAATQAQRAATARSKALGGLPAFAQAGGVNDLAGTGGEMVPPRLERVASPADAVGAGQWGRTLTLTIQVNTMDDVRREVNAALDRAFA